MRCAVKGCSIGAILFAFPMTAFPRLPQVKAKVICDKAEHENPVLKSPETSEVIGSVKCGSEVTLADPKFSLTETKDGLFLEPMWLREWSSKHDFLVHIVFEKSPTGAWMKGKAELLPDQRFRVALVGQPVDKTVCDGHGGYQKTESARKDDPLNLFGQFVVCKDGSRILQN